MSVSTKCICRAKVSDQIAVWHLLFGLLVDGVVDTTGDEGLSGPPFWRKICWTVRDNERTDFGIDSQFLYSPTSGRP